MPQLKIKQNYGHYFLSSQQHGSVRICCKSGEVRVAWFVGFIEREDAAVLAGAIPIKLEVAAYAITDDVFPDWISVHNGEVVQGCYLSDHEIYAVTERGAPRIVKRTYPEAPAYFDIQTGIDDSLYR